MSKKGKVITRKIYKCDKCKETQIIENFVIVPESVKYLLLSSCIHCDLTRDVNVFKRYVFNEKKI